MNCLSYKGYVLKVGEAPIHTRKGLKQVDTIVTTDNYKEVINLIDNA